MRNVGFFVILFLSLNASPVFSEDLPELKTISSLDISKYLGDWYEIARFPNSFQKDCNQATARYSLREDGEIDVLNTCVRDQNKGKKEILGRGYIEDVKTSAKLKVSFLPGFLRWTGVGMGQYWVIDLGSKYEYAVVSEPNRKYLWILSRTPTIAQGLYQKILIRLKEQHFDTSKLMNSRDNSAI